MSDDEISIVLESPPVAESSVMDKTVGAIFGAEAFPLVISKLTFMETLFGLVTKDLRFSDFTRETLLLVMKVIKCEAGALFEVNPTEGNLFFRTAVGQSSDRVTSFVVPMGKGVVGHVAESRQMLNVTNAKENKVHLQQIANAVGFETRNLIAVPILVRGQLYGVLELLNRVGEENFVAADEELLGYLCPMIARAVELRMMLAWVAKKKAEKEEAA